MPYEKKNYYDRNICSTGIGGGGYGGGNSSNKTLYEEGLEVISLMEEMASNDTYLKIYSASSEIQDIVRNAGEGDFSEPKAITRLQFQKKLF